jgi:hypothetical protein
MAVWKWSFQARGRQKQQAGAVVPVVSAEVLEIELEWQSETG